MEVHKEYTGYWYTQDNPEDKVFGILKRSIDNDIILKTHDVLENPEKFFNIMDSEPLSIINGYTSDGKHMTLIDNFNTSLTIHAPGTPTSTYEPRYLIEGEKYKNIDDIRFINIKVSYSYFNEWIGVSPLKYEIGSNKHNIIVRGEPLLLIYELDELKIKINSDVKKRGDLLKKIELIHSASVTFERKNGFSLAETFDVIQSFANFLILCIGRRVTYSFIEAKDMNNQSINIYINGMKKQKEKKISRYDVLTPYLLIKNDFEKYINNWFKKRGRMKPILDYFVSLHDETFHVPISFLKIVQALEAFSRRMRNNYIIDKEEHKKRISYILEKIDDAEYREWIEEKIEYSNEPNLRKRLNMLFKELNFIIDISSKKRKKLVNDIVETRNYYTHFDESKKDKIMDSDKIFYVGNLLIFILRVLIMKELGINEDVIIDIKEHKRTSYIIEKALE